MCCLFSLGATAQTASPYEVYALRYATLPGFPVAELVKGADPTRKLNIAMIVCLVRGNGRTILVDSGFYRPQFFKDWKVNEYVRPDALLAKVGVKPEDVTDVIITHMHWDHADGADLFPKARIWLQQDEYTYYTGQAWQGAHTHGGIDPDDVVMMVKKNIGGQLGLVAGDAQEIVPGITCYIGGKHTYQAQYVAVRTAHGTVVLASDNMYLYENLDKHVPIAATLDAESNLKAQDRMKTLATKPEWIVPGHDPAEFVRFTKVAEGVVKVD
jgi:glyoxylase-like metal-dependent hydrolase (beta-lactamase superfamily II)